MHWTVMWRVSHAMQWIQCWLHPYRQTGWRYWVQSERGNRDDYEERWSNSKCQHFAFQSVSTDWLAPMFFNDVTASWSRPDVTLHFLGKCTLTLALWTVIIIYYIQETYMSQNNFKSSSTTRNWRKLQHTAILSSWRHFCKLCLSKNSFLDDSAHELLLIPHMNFEMFDDSAHIFWRMIMQDQH